jgi:hypothetical protein
LFKGKEKLNLFIISTMKKTWIFLINPMLTATENSFLNAYRISVFHLAALQAHQADPIVAAMLAAYIPIHNALVIAYNAWRTQGGAQQGETVNLKSLLSQLSKKIKQWDVFIQTKYPQDTQAYVKLLPNHRIPFQRASQIERVTALKDLNDLVSADVNLVLIKPEVNTLNTLLNDAFNHQKTSLATTGVNSDSLEKARVDMCVAQFANYGGLLQKHAASPTDLEKYFDLEHIRRNMQDVFASLLTPKEVHFIAKRTIDNDAQIEITSTGLTELFMYRGDKKDAQAGADGVIIPAGDTVTVPASQLGDAANHFYIIRNNDPAHDGSFEVYFK